MLIHIEKVLTVTEFYFYPCNMHLPIEVGVFIGFTGVKEQKSLPIQNIEWTVLLILYKTMISHLTNPNMSMSACDILNHCLFQCNIPIELRYIVTCFTCEVLSNINIHDAVRLWCNDPIIVKLRYGHISYWDTSIVTIWGPYFISQDISMKI